MYSTGQFALILGVSARTLRYYNEIGLLIPEYTNEENGYRFYKEEQMDNAKRILAFKEAGLTLDEIKELTEPSTSPISSQIIINRKKILLDEIKALEKKIKKLDNLNNHGFEVPQNDISNEYKLEITEIPNSYVLENVSQTNIKETGKVVGNLYEELARNKLPSTGIHYIEYLDDYDPENNKLRVFIPITSNIPKINKYKKFQGGRYLSLKVHSLSKKKLAYKYLFDWVNNNKIEADGKTLERYSITDGLFTLEILCKLK